MVDYPCKYVDREIELIQRFSSDANVSIEDYDSLNKVNGCFKKKKERGFTLDIESQHFLRLHIGEIRKLTLKNSDYKLSIDAYVYGYRVSTMDKLSFTNSLTVFSFREFSFKDNSEYYCRKILPIIDIAERANLSFYYIINAINFIENNITTVSKGLVEVTISGHTLQLFFINKDDCQFLFIDCIEKIDPSLFNDLAWSILVGVGYLLGNIPQDDGYNFYYSNRDHKDYITYDYRELRPTLRSIYHPFHSSPHSWINNNEYAKTYAGKINRINFQQVSKLCEIIHNEMEIKAILLLMIESMTRTQLLMPSGLSIALEGLSEYFYKKSSSKLKPIKDPAIEKQFKTELKLVLSKYKNLENFHEAHAIIEEKINQINSPTNLEKLKAPFTYLGIKLTKMDEEAIRSRNAFLHGNVTLKVSEGRKPYLIDTYEISLRLMTLINCVIFKMIGYKGYILNHVKLQNQDNNEINEDFIERFNLGKC